MADAITKGCKHVITSGSQHSNHCRATAIAANLIGLKAHLILSTNETNKEKLGCTDNFMLDRLCCSSIFMVPRLPIVKDLLAVHTRKMEKLSVYLKESQNEDSYIIGVGGSNQVGLFGYITAFQELISQALFDNYDDVVFACASGGTAAGLCIANYLTGSRVKCHAILISHGITRLTEGHIQSALDEVGLGHIKSTDIVDIVEPGEGREYASSTKEELDFIVDVSRSTGIILDPVYTGKAAHSLVQELTLNPSRFKGNRILFIHTGGVFGMFNGTLNETLLSKKHDQVLMWPNIDSDVPPTPPGKRMRRRGGGEKE